MMKQDSVKIMGILNITPDSFYAESRCVSEMEILRTAERMLDEGADILDVGGVSTRPDCDFVTEEEEIGRILFAVRSLVRHFPGVTLSVDTFRPKVAHLCCDEGCKIINDISGGCDEMYGVLATYDVSYVLMHFIGKDGKMSMDHHYSDILNEMMEYFKDKINRINSFGVKDIIIDPGFGFSKNIEENWYVLDNLNVFTAMNLPILVGLSRKSMIYKPLSISPQDSLEATLSANRKAVENGASILRVHDVKEHKNLL